MNALINSGSDVIVDYLLIGSIAAGLLLYDWQKGETVWH